MKNQIKTDAQLDDEEIILDALCKSAARHAQASPDGTAGVFLVTTGRGRGRGREKGQIVVVQRGWQTLMMDSWALLCQTYSSDTTEEIAREIRSAIFRAGQDVAKLSLAPRLYEYI